jgi:septum formation protein
MEQLGFSFISIAADIDESVYANELADDYVLRVAQAKAKEIAIQHDSTTIVLGSDTCVAIDNHILGKPVDYQDYRRHMMLLSGNVHQVLTAVVVVQGERCEQVLVTTNVEFKTLSEPEIEYYWRTGEPQDKAGSYGIQGFAGQFVKAINGSYTSVVGLPLVETNELLQKFGVKPDFES